MEKRENDFWIDMDEITTMIDDLKKENKSSSKNRWAPPTGTSVIRIVPYVQNRKNPFVRMYFHWNIGKTAMLSPVTHGRPDPIDEASKKLFEKAREGGSKDDWKLAKKLEPKLRVYAPVIIRGSEEQGVKWWGFGKEIFAEILNVIKSGDYDDITHPIQGRDIKVERKTKEEAGNDYGKTTIRVLPKVSPISSDKKLLKDILTVQPDPNELYPEPTYEDLREALRRYLDPEAEVDDNIESTETTISESEKISETKGDPKVDSVIDQFDDVLNEIKSKS